MAVVKQLYIPRISRHVPTSPPYAYEITTPPLASLERGAAALPVTLARCSVTAMQLPLELQLPLQHSLEL